MFLSQEYKAKWSFTNKLYFRFVFVYFTLYIFLMFTNSAFESFFRWIGNSILGIAYDYAVSGNGSGDNTYAFISLFVNIMLTPILVVFWSLFDSGRNSYNTLWYWFLVFLRVVLIIAMFIYGAVKVYQIQFPQPSLVRLLEPLGNFSPMGLAWTYMGYSEGFNMFSGALEIIGGLLLIPRRTQTLGAFIVMGVMTHVAVMNFMFDIPVKLLSTHLVLMAFVIFLTDIKRFVNVFISNKETKAISYFHPVTYPFYHKVIFGIKCITLAIICISVCTLGYKAEHNRGHKREKPFLYGIWETSHFEKNDDTIAPLITETSRWRYLILDFENKATIKMMDDTKTSFHFIVDSTSKRIKIYKYDSEIGDYNFTYEHPNGKFLQLNGTMENDSLKITFSKKDLNAFKLKSRGFHWINESPYNR